MAATIGTLTLEVHVTPMIKSAKKTLLVLAMFNLADKRLRIRTARTIYRIGSAITCLATRIAGKGTTTEGPEIEREGPA